MSTVTKTAFANLRQNKSRNILCGIAVLLTTLLIFLILNIGTGMVTVQFAGVNRYYPTYHFMFRQVSQENADALKSHDDIESIGLREDFAQIPDDDATIIMMALDSEGLALNKVSPEEGSLPLAENEIAVCRSMLDDLGMEAEVGDEITLPFQLYEGNGLGYEIRDTFRISGFLDQSDTAASDKSYAAITSMAYMEKTVPADQREYRVMIRLSGVRGMTSDAIEERAREIGADFGIDETNIVCNDDYLAANYTDPSLTAGMTAIVLVIVLAGILTIYSIYYVSMVPRVQEYGKLKALGATKRQIRQIVFREGLIVTAATLPLGLALGSLIFFPVILGMYGVFGTSDGMSSSASEFNRLCADMIRNGEVSLFHPWIYLLTIAAVLVTVYLALVRPMRTASKISPVEAIRYQGTGREKKKQRRGYQDMNLFRLTSANLSRNRKRTALTVVTLSAVGILFMTVASVLSCAAPKEIAREDIESDFRIYIESWEDDKMNPDRAWSVIMQDNPMDERFLEQLSSVPGVEKVRTKSLLCGSLPDLDPDGTTYGKAYVTGLDDSYAEELEEAITQGDVSYEDLLSGDKLLVNWTFQYWHPESRLGDPVRILFDTPDGPVERTFELAGICHYSSGFTDSEFILPESVLSEICPYDLTNTCEITVDAAQKETAYETLQSLADTDERFVSDTYEDFVAQWESVTSFISLAGYAFLIILGAIGVMNLVNTMINSVYTRKHELGILQAVGMSERQLTRMMQMEGLFYTLCTLILSLGLGRLAGYAAFLYARSEGLMNITVFHYPFLQAVLLTVTVATVQLVLTFAVTKSFRRTSLIERVRYSE